MQHSMIIENQTPSFIPLYRNLSGSIQGLLECVRPILVSTRSWFHTRAIIAKLKFFPFSFYQRRKKAF